MDPTARRRRTMLIAAIAVGLILTLLIGVGMYGLIRGPQPIVPDGAAPSDQPTATAPVPEPAGPEPVSALGGPEEFAAAVGEALFTWDTSSGYGPADYAQMLADVTADSEADAAASDVRAYLPTPEAWTQLRTHQTRQWLTIDTITVPETWPGVVANARPGTLPPGAAAYTITGSRHRVGSWEGQDVSDARPVSFTIFAACPSGDSCRLLRLSAVDTPMS